MKIDELINDYFEGQTTLEQERQLRNWFAATPLEKMTPQQREVAPLFAAVREERMALENLPQAKSSHHWAWYLSAGVVAASLLLGIILYSAKPTISVVKEPAITMTIGGVVVEGDAAAKEFANEQMKKLSRIMNKNTFEQKIGIFQKMILRADNILNNNKIEDNQDENTQK